MVVKQFFCTRTKKSVKFELAMVVHTQFFCTKDKQSLKNKIPDKVKLIKLCSYSTGCKYLEAKYKTYSINTFDFAGS